MMLRKPVLDSGDDNFDTCLHKKHALPGLVFISQLMNIFYTAQQAASDASPILGNSFRIEVQRRRDNNAQLWR